MQDFIRLGDATDHGGKVITASSSMIFHERRVACKGDEVSCPLHPEVRPNRIIDGDETMLVEGDRPLAHHGYRTMCGCRVISSLL